MWNTLFFLAAIALAQVCHGCVHDQFALKTTKHFLNDLTDKRLLAPTQVGRLRIFVDYSQVTVGGDTEINTIKRATNITANYFYNLLNVTRLPRLYYPANTSRICNSIQVPSQYVTNGTIGDLGVICANEQNTNVQYIAKSTPCAFLQSTKRPIWGMMSWNNAFLKFDQVGFQQLLYIGMHEMTHIVGFSAMLYDIYPKGSPLVSGPNGEYYLNSSKLQAQIKNQFNCTKSLGLPLEDQDGTLIASHWEKKVVGNQFMIASLKKGAYVSRFTLALLQSSGWYQSVNYNYSQPTVWGKGRGCDFLNIDICQGNEFCQGSNFGCDWQSTGIGICSTDPYTGSCQVFKYYTNTICVDQNFEMKNLNSKLNALQRGGSGSRCFNSDFRQTGLTTTKLNSRCYVSVCSPTGTSVFVLVGSYVLVCRTPGQNVTAPPGMQGALFCPKSFDNICQSKKTCPYHCNKNGACVDGKCMCTGSLKLTPSCVDISVYLAPVGTTGGLLNALIDGAGSLNLDNSNDLNETRPYNVTAVKKVSQYSLNQKCIQGTVLDPDFGECILCSELYGCQSCNENGCTVCDNGKRPVGKSCFR